MLASRRSSPRRSSQGRPSQGRSSQGRPSRHRPSESRPRRPSPWVRARSLLALTLGALLLVLLFAEAADAQRRRRRRPRPQPTEEPAEQTPPSEGEGEATEEAPAEGEDTPAAAPEETAEEAPAAEAPPPEPMADPTADLPDLGPLRADFATLMDELVQARSRIAVLGNQLFRTKVRVLVENRADDAVLASFALRLDGAPIFRADGPIGEEGRQVFEGFAAPGPHELTIEAEQRARENDTYRYLQRGRYRFEVVQGKVTEITLVLDDDSDIAEDFEDDGEGEYDVSTRVRVATRDLESEN